MIRKMSLSIALFALFMLTAGHLMPVFAAPSPATTPSTNVCDLVGSSAKGACTSCMNNGKGTWTAIGCIQADPQSLVTAILNLGIGLGGGIAFLLILFGGFQILTSAGNPEQLNEGRELVGSAITGLLFILFSIFLLRFIGVNLFGIPGFK